MTNIESLFAELLGASRVQLTAAEIQEVQHFLDVGEYGIALETFVHIFLEEKKPATQAALSIVRDLARSMKLDLDALVLQIETLEKPLLPE